MKDSKIFDSIYREYYPGLLAFSKWLTGNEAEGHEIVQEVFIKVWEKNNLTQDDPRIKSYLYTAVKNKALNAIRDKKHFSEIDHENQVLDYRLNAHEQLEYNTLKAQIDFAIGKLPERCKMVFLLRRREGMSQRAIAELMEISEKTVENQMTKAMRMIKEFLEINQK